MENATATALDDTLFPLEETPEQALDRLAWHLQEDILTPAQLGRLGEDIASLWMQACNCTILGRNWHSRYGELDLIALDPDGEIVFVEVKTRRSTRFGLPQEAVTPHKQANLRRAAAQWLMEHHTPHRGIRFDVISILAPLDQAPSIHHIREAF